MIRWLRVVQNLHVDMALEYPQSPHHDSLDSIGHPRDSVEQLFVFVAGPALQNPAKAKNLTHWHLHPGPLNHPTFVHLISAGQAAVLSSIAAFRDPGLVYKEVLVN